MDIKITLSEDEAKAILSDAVRLQLGAAITPDHRVIVDYGRYSGFEVSVKPPETVKEKEKRERNQREMEEMQNAFPGNTPAPLAPYDIFDEKPL